MINSNIEIHCFMNNYVMSKDNQIVKLNGHIALEWGFIVITIAIYILLHIFSSIIMKAYKRILKLCECVKECTTFK
jgi:hypothetical protein